MTEYLTQRGKIDRKKYKPAIPNHKIREIFAEQIQEWFLEKVRRDQVNHSNYVMRKSNLCPLENPAGLTFLSAADITI